MNIINAYAFNELMKADTEYRSKIETALSTYRTSMERVRNEAKRYKDEDDHIRNNQPGHAEKAMNAINSARKQFEAELKSTIRTMRENLGKYLSEPLNTDFAAKLKLYDDYGVKMCKSEVTALLKMNAGNPFGLRALDSVLAKTSADWRLEYRDTRLYEQDIEKLERMAANLPVYAPDEYHHEACELYKNTRIRYFKQGSNETYESGTTFDSVSIIMNSVDHKTTMESVETMRQSWTCDVSTPQIDSTSEHMRKEKLALNESLRAQGIADEYLDEVPDDAKTTTSVKESDEKALGLARELGARDADAVKAYNKGMEAFKH